MRIDIIETAQRSARRGTVEVDTPSLSHGSSVETLVKGTKTFWGKRMTERNDSLMARAVHDAYVHAVIDELTERGIRVADLLVDADVVRRAAMVVAEVDPMNPTWQDSGGVVRLHWDERHGWNWQVQYPSEPHRRGAVHFGVSAVPQPAAVADWMLISLARPDAVPSREDGPFETADLEAVLRAYAVT